MRLKTPTRNRPRNASSKWDVLAQLGVRRCGHGSAPWIGSQTGATVRFTEQGSGDPFETRTTERFLRRLPSRHWSSASRAPNHTETQLGAFSQPAIPWRSSFHLSHSTQVRLATICWVGGCDKIWPRAPIESSERRRQAVAAGVYFYRLVAGEFAASQKLVGWEQESAFHGELVPQGGGTGAVRRGDREALRMENVQPFAREFDTQFTVSLGRRRELLSSGESALLLGVPRRFVHHGQ